MPLPLKVRNVIYELKNLSPGTIEPERGGPQDEAGDDHGWHSRQHEDCGLRQGGQGKKPNVISNLVLD